MSEDVIVGLLRSFGTAVLADLVGRASIDAVSNILKKPIRETELAKLLVARYGHGIFSEKKIREELVKRMSEKDRSGLGLVGDRYSIRWSVGSRRVNDFLRLAGVDETYGPKPASTVVASEKLEVEFPLHAYQRRVRARALQILEAPGSKLLLHLPTGAGKTRTAVELMVDMMRSSPNDESFIVWFAHSEELCEQAADAIAGLWKKKGDRDIEIVRMWGGAENQAFPAAAFVVASFQSLYSKLSSQNSDLSWINHIRQRARLIVVDEAHKVTAPTYRRAVESLTGITTDARVLGLSATPGRGEDDSSNSELVNFFDSKKITLQSDSGEDLQDSIGYLQDRGFLAKIDREKIQSRINIEIGETEIESIRNSFDFSDGFLKRLGEENQRNVLIISRLNRLIDEGRQIILFACSVSHAHVLNDLCVMQGHETRVITGATHPYDRKKWIDEYKDGPVRVLINYGVLTTGFDAPNTDTVFITRPTTSVVLYSQMVGRGIRGKKMGGNDRCLVIDVVDNFDGMPNEAMAFNYFNSTWN